MNDHMKGVDMKGFANIYPCMWIEDWCRLDSVMAGLDNMMKRPLVDKTVAANSKMD